MIVRLRSKKATYMSIIMGEGSSLRGAINFSGAVQFEILLAMANTISARRQN